MSKVNICLACDNNYAKYAGVVIASILHNADIDTLLSFFVLDGGISEQHKQEILTLKSIKDLGVKCGAVINPNTEVKAIENIIDDIDMLLLMSVYPGFGGQKFIPEVLPKIEQAAKLIEKTGKDIDLEIDGGITKENVKLVKDAGANVIVAGSTIYKEPDRAAVIKYLREI